MAAMMRIYAGEPWPRACAVQHSLLRSLHPTHPSSNHPWQGGLFKYYTVKRPKSKSSLMRQIAPLEYINTLLKRSIPKKPR